MTSQIITICADPLCESFRLLILSDLIIPTMVRLTTFLKAKIVVLWEQEQSIKKIARDMGITVRVIR